MNIYLIGSLINICLLIGAGASLAVGCITYSREKSAGTIRIQLLIISVAAFVWGFCYGILGFLRNFDVVRIIRTIGIAGIEVFLLNEFLVVSGLANLKTTIRHGMNVVASIIVVIDFFIFIRPKVDQFYMADGYMTWVGNDCFERDFHQVVVILIFVSMAVLGVIAYKRYELKRQKQFFTLFYCANLLLMLFSALDTFYVFEHPLPTSGLGAIICSMLLCVGTSRNNAFSIAASEVFDKVYDVINDGILMFDNNRKIIYANEYINSIIGNRNCAGKELTDIFDLSIEECDGCFDGSTKKDGMQGLHLKLKNSPIICNSKLVCVRDKFGEIYCYIMSVSDITRELKMLDEMQQANEAKSHFLASISHEIRTPINTVLGMNEMIRRESKDADILEYSGDIERSGQQLLSIINDILDFTKIESGELELYNSSYDLTSMINNLYLVVNPKIIEKKLELILKINPETPSWLYGDEIRINQILNNLISNAIKYTDEGFVQFECDFEVVDKDNINLVIAVRDSGRGIKNVENSHIFDAFIKLDEKKNQSIEGTGLGLALTKAILDSMGGTIAVESIYGVGSKFTVSIPQHISNRIPVGNLSERIITANKQIQTYEESFVAPDARILIVDDVEMNMMVVAELLKNTMMIVDKASSGKEAIKKCKENQYHVILMDHMMPEMDGIECLKIIRKSGEINSKTPIIVLTANAIVGMRDMYINEGFDDYLTKPIDGVKLEGMIKAYLPEELLVV